jgi:NADH-quinone oxidoreductase subunit N
MNYSLLWLEMLVALLGAGVLLADLWLPAEPKKWLGRGAGLILVASAIGIVVQNGFDFAGSESAFQRMYLQDGLATYFRVFFLLAGALVLCQASEYAPHFGTAASEFSALVLFALTGMLLAASANDFMLMFVALELVTVTFYVLVSFERRRTTSLEAGVKYLILGALASGFLVFGTALIFGSAGTTNFSEILAHNKELAKNHLFLTGLLLVLVGLGFKIAAFPFQVWAPDVYQGAPVPTTAFLSVGSKAAGFVLLLRVLYGAVPAVALEWRHVLGWLAAGSILYGSLCAIPQRSLKRLFGYSSIANAGFLLLGVAAVSDEGNLAVLYYLAGYLFTVLGAFAVLSAAASSLGGDDLSQLSGLGRRSPLLATGLTVSMVSLAGVPPLAGFLGKFLLFKAILAHASVDVGYRCLLGVALVGAVISLYYYFGVIRSIFWGAAPQDLTSIRLSLPARISVLVCVVGTLLLGTLPQPVLLSARSAISNLKPEAIRLQAQAPVQSPASR